MDPIDYTTMQTGSPFTPTIEDRRIGFGKRFLAYLIDALLAVIIAVLITGILLSMNITIPSVVGKDFDALASRLSSLGFGMELVDKFSHFFSILVVASTTSSLAYSLIEGLTGASPGKRVLRILIANADGTRGDTTLFLRRWAFKNSSVILSFLALLPALAFMEWISSLVGLVVFIGFFMALAASKQALHDRIANSAVFDAE